jgi:hypothetical protein
MNIGIYRPASAGLFRCRKVAQKKVTRELAFTGWSGTLHSHSERQVHDNETNQKRANPKELQKEQPYGNKN